MLDPTSRNSAITLAFSASELAQLKAFAALHGLPVAVFVQKAALEAAHISAPSPQPISDDSWLRETPAFDPSDPGEPELFRVGEPETEKSAGASTDFKAAPAVSAAKGKRGVVGEPSKLARGQGLVWEIRRALGQERVHGLGWTREHLAFVLKLSVVGVRKMERLGTTPLKSLEARRALLKLARTLENPTPEISAYIAAEAADLESE